MPKFSSSIQPWHMAFIEKQHIFFVATAPLSTSGRINLSPKGMDTFRILSENRVAYADFIGSGNETSAHTLENGRITFMFCAFEGAPNILRLYGKGFALLPGVPEWETFAPHFKLFPNTRQIIVADLDLVQTSCGYGVPLFEYVGEREFMFEWAARKGEQGLKDYILEKNLASIDGLPTDYGTRAQAAQSSTEIHS